MASALEKKFALYWRMFNGPSLETEYQFCPDRKFRADFASIDNKLLFEVEGGQWVMGRHQRGAGYAKDAEKYNIATALGWRVFRVTSSMLTPSYVEDLIRIARNLAPSKSFYSVRK
jgi:very-short-patch-repair endonuclease